MNRAPPCFSLLNLAPPPHIPTSILCFSVYDQTSTVGDDHKEHEELIHSVQSGLNSLLGSEGLGTKNKARSANLLEELKVNIRKFGKEVREHMDNEEHFYSTPVTRKVRHHQE